jgi:hypothetical protein
VADDIIREALRLLSGTVSLPVLIGIIVVLAVVLVLLRKLGGMKIEPRPPVPDPVETPPSPPIEVRPDGTIPVGNPVEPPEVIP